MIEFAHRDNILQIKIQTCLDTERPVLLREWTCGSGIEAAALKHFLQKRLADLVEAARRQAYLDGYRDGRAKRGKQTYFSRVL